MCKRPTKVWPKLQRVTEFNLSDEQRKRLVVQKRN
jgi:hypothetical protein